MGKPRMVRGQQKLPVKSTVATKTSKAVPASSKRGELEARWYALMREKLPAAARAEGGWPIQLDHCFMRVVLDNYFKTCWYNVLDKQKGAVKSMADKELTGAVELAEKLLADGRDAVKVMNRKSLDFRGKQGPKK